MVDRAVHDAGLFDSHEAYGPVSRGFHWVMAALLAVHPEGAKENDEHGKLALHYAARSRASAEAEPRRPVVQW